MAFAEDFTGTNGANVYQRSGWSRQAAPVSGSIQVYNNGLSPKISSGTEVITFTDQGSPYQELIFRNKYAGSTNKTTDFICINLVDASNFIGVRKVTAALDFVKNVAGSVTSLDTTALVLDEWIKVARLDANTIAWYSGGTGVEPGTWTLIDSFTETAHNTETSMGLVCSGFWSAPQVFIDDLSAQAVGGTGIRRLIADNILGRSLIRKRTI